MAFAVDQRQELVAAAPTFSLDRARDLVMTTPVPEEVPALRFTDNQPVFDKVKDQALVVGSDVISFASGVDNEFREALSDSALLAQFAADAAAPATQDPIGYFDAYFGVLANIGWVTQLRDTAVYKFEGDGMEVHEAIADVIGAFLAPAPTALKLVTAALKSLKSMSKDSPLITLFNRESQKANVGHFQFTLVRQDPGKGLMAEAVAFGLQAEKEITQILFFKMHKAKTTLRRSQAQFSINAEAVRGVRPQLQAKLTAHRDAFVAAIPLPPQG